MGARHGKNEYRIEGNVVFLKLTQGLWTALDLADLSLALNYRWRAASGYVRGRCQNPKSKRQVLLHRVLKGVENNDPHDPEVDHRDNDGFNNRRNNLRVGNSTQNKCNVSLRSDNKTGFKGVYRRRGGFSGQVAFEGKKMSVGIHETAESAARACDDLRRKFHGDFARLNFPEQNEASACL